MVRGRLRSLVNIALVSSVEVSRVELSMLLRVAVVSACVLGAAIAGTGWPSPRISDRNRPAPSWSASCSPIPASKAPPAWAAFSPMARSSAPSACAARVSRALPLCRPAPSGSTAARCARISPACRSRRAFGCRRSITGASAARCPDLGFAYCDFYQRNPRTQMTGAPGERPCGDAGCQYAPGTAAFASGITRIIRLPDSHSRSSRNGVASAAISPRPMVSIAATMRPFAAEEPVGKRDDADVRRRGR